MEREKENVFQQSMQCEESKTGPKIDKEARVRRCCDYMQTLKSVLSADEFAQYLQYLKLLKGNYASDKISFYATVVFQIFFPNSPRQLPTDFSQRKELFLQSKAFYPRGSDRDQYTRECEDLLARFDSSVVGNNARNESGKVQTDVTCMICMDPYERTKDFYKAKCGHVACGQCWFTWLATCLECPMCKRRTRTKQLVKIQ